MHLPLAELMMAVRLGKVFRAAFKQRLLECEQSLTAAALATYGGPLLEAVGQVIQRYLRNVDLLTGCGPLAEGRNVIIDRCGRLTDAFTSVWCPQPHAYVRKSMSIHRSSRTGDPYNLELYLSGLGGQEWSCEFMLRSPGSRCPAKLRNERATFSDECQNECLGAMFFIADQVGLGSLGQESREAPQQARAVAPSLSGEPDPVQPPQGNAGEADPGPVSRASRAILGQPPRPVAARSVKRLSAHLPGFTISPVSFEEVDQGVALAMKMAAAFQVPCCEVKMRDNIVVYACENKRFCGAHRVHS